MDFFCEKLSTSVWLLRSSFSGNSCRIQIPGTRIFIKNKSSLHDFPNSSTERAMCIRLNPHLFISSDFAVLGSGRCFQSHFECLESSLDIFWAGRSNILMNARLSDSAFLTVQISRHRDGSYYSENADLITAEIVEKKIVIVLYSTICIWANLSLKQFGKRLSELRWFLRLTVITIPYCWTGPNLKMI